MELVPFKFFKTPSAKVPFPARSARVFFTTWYLPPAACTARRNLVSFSTVMPWKVVRISVDTLASSAFKLSKSFCFSLFFFISSFPPASARLSCRCQGLRFRQIDPNCRVHGRGKGDLLNVLAFRRRGLGLSHSRDQDVGVFCQLARIKINFSYRAMHDSRFIHAEFHFARFGFLHRFGHVCGNRSGL